VFWTQSIVQSRKGGKALDTSVSEVPADIEFDGLLDFYREELGEPRDAAYTDIPDVGQIDIGWVFDVPKGWKLPGPRKKYEMVVIPLVQDPDDKDELISLGVLLTEYSLTESDDG
jgi:hypothetical protein